MKKYLVNTATNFSIGENDFYLQPGTTVELPDHELIEGMLIHGHLKLVSSPKKENTNTLK